MESGESRDSLRVPCDFPIRVYGQMREMNGRMVDVSRSGVQIRVPLSRVLMTPEVDFAAIAHAVGQMLGASFLADLHHEMLGQLVRKTLRTVRVGAVDVDADWLEIGCAIEEPLNDEETVMLGIGLPPVGVTGAAAFKSVPPPRRRSDPEDTNPDQPRPTGYAGILHPSEGHHGEPIVGNTEGVVGDEIVVTFPVRNIPYAVGAQPSVLLETIQFSFGGAPRLEILDGIHMVWAGPVQIVELDLPEDEAGNALLLLKTA